MRWNIGRALGYTRSRDSANFRNYLDTAPGLKCRLILTTDGSKSGFLEHCIFGLKCNVINWITDLGFCKFLNIDQHVLVYCAWAEMKRSFIHKILAFQSIDIFTQINGFSAKFAPGTGS